MNKYLKIHEAARECVIKEEIPVKMNPAYLVSRKYLGEYFEDVAEYANPYDEDPEDLHTVSFNPDGSALGGNINRDSILDIIAGYRP